ncbi:MAG: hypothetical protein M3Q27_12845 [Actinomycetota bacterium]|nr:hypothetical protein [Actinomycetota bacterium]
MRRALPVLGIVSALLLAAAMVWSYALRADDLHAGLSALLGVGTVVGLAAVLGMVVVERRPDGLAVSDGARLPTPEWPWPVLAIGLCDLVAGMYASWPFGALGVVLVGIATAGFGARLRSRTAVVSAAGDDAADGVPGNGSTAGGSHAVASPQVLDRGVVVAARRVRSFAERHGGADAGFDVGVQHVGRGDTRLVVVAPDGAFGDVVVRGSERARQAAELSGGRVSDELAADASARVRTSAYEWRRMAGQQLPVRRR